MVDPVKAVELVLRSVFRAPDLESAGDRGFHVASGNGAELHFESLALLEAALFIRRNASSHLRSLSVEDLQKMLVRFISDEVDLFRSDWWRLPRDTPLADKISPEEKAALAEAMSCSQIFSPSQVLFLYPIKIAQIAVPFRDRSFFLLAPKDLPHELAPWYDADEIKPEQHPPTPMHDGMRFSETSSWLGIRSPLEEIAMRTRNAVLGACALLPHPLQRYSFSMGAVPTGYMSFDSRATYHSGDASTPALGEKLIFGKSDHAWMALLGHKLTSDVDRDRKGVLALQYFYRAWVRDPAMRVAPLCGALDALFGDRDAATQAMVDAVGVHLGPTFDMRRAKRLAKLRAGVIHGGAPNIYEASVYHSYYVEYRADPIRDLELATARCLQQEIFGNAMSQRPHPYAGLIKQYTGATV